MTVYISAVRGEHALNEVRTLLRHYNHYLDTLGVNLCFQNFEDELAALPGQYVLPHGECWLAHDEHNTPLGVIAVKPLDEAYVCEMKRLWVEDAAKGNGLGRRLAETAINFARAAGYRQMKLDTLGTRMHSAVALYRKLGFVETTTYVHNPERDVLFMVCNLLDFEGS